MRWDERIRASAVAVAALTVGCSESDPRHRGVSPNRRCRPCGGDGSGPRQRLVAKVPGFIVTHTQWIGPRWRRPDWPVVRLSVWSLVGLPSNVDLVPRYRVKRQMRADPTMSRRRERTVCVDSVTRTAAIHRRCLPAVGAYRQLRGARSEQML